MIFNVERYLESAALVGPLLAGLHPNAFEPSSALLPEASSAVYVATGHDGQVLYVGSVCRGTGQALRARIAEHLRYRPAAAAWAGVWVVELRDDLEVDAVRWAEARVGRPLQPAGNQRLPRFPVERSRSGDRATHRSPRGLHGGRAACS